MVKLLTALLLLVAMGGTAQKKSDSIYSKHLKEMQDVRDRVNNILRTTGDTLPTLTDIIKNGNQVLAVGRPAHVTVPAIYGTAWEGLVVRDLSFSGPPVTIDMRDQYAYDSFPTISGWGSYITTPSTITVYKQPRYRYDTTTFNKEDVKCSHRLAKQMLSLSGIASCLVANCNQHPSWTENFICTVCLWHFNVSAYSEQEKQSDPYEEALQRLKAILSIKNIEQ